MVATGAAVPLNAIGQTGTLPSPVQQLNGWEARIDNVSGFTVRLDCGNWSTYLGPGASVIHMDTANPPLISFTVASQSMSSPPPTPQLLTTWANLPERVPPIVSLSAFIRSVTAPNTIAGTETLLPFPALSDLGVFTTASPPPTVSIQATDYLVSSTSAVLTDSPGIFSISAPTNRVIGSDILPNSITPVLLEVSASLATAAVSLTSTGDSVPAPSNPAASLATQSASLNGASDAIPCSFDTLIGLHT